MLSGILVLVLIQHGICKTTFDGVFPGAPIQITTTEELPVGSTIGVLKASTDQNPSGIRYELEDQEFFEVDAISGTLKNKKIIDFEKKKVLYLSAFAYTDPSQKAEAQLLVQVKNINDNIPLFTQPSYEVHVKEDLNIGGFVGKVTAIDADETDIVSYKLNTHNDLFQINNDGVITSRALLDYEKKEVHRLNISSSDGELSSSVILFVYVDDNDDQGAVFEKDVYTGHIEEGNYQQPVKVVAVHAYDLDFGLNDSVSYQLLQENSLVLLNNETGEVFLHGNIDREEKQTIEIQILVCFYTFKSSQPSPGPEEKANKMRFLTATLSILVCCYLVTCEEENKEKQQDPAASVGGYGYRKTFGSYGGNGGYRNGYSGYGSHRGYDRKGYGSQKRLGGYGIYGSGYENYYGKGNYGYGERYRGYGRFGSGNGGYGRYGNRYSGYRGFGNYALGYVGYGYGGHGDLYGSHGRYGKSHGKKSTVYYDPASPMKSKKPDYYGESYSSGGKSSYYASNKSSRKKSAGKKTSGKKSSYYFSYYYPSYGHGKGYGGFGHGYGYGFGYGYGHGDYGRGFGRYGKYGYDGGYGGGYGDGYGGGYDGYGYGGFGHGKKSVYYR